MMLFAFKTFAQQHHQSQQQQPCSPHTGKQSSPDSRIQFPITVNAAIHINESSSLKKISSSRQTEITISPSQTNRSTFSQQTNQQAKKPLDTSLSLEPIPFFVMNGHPMPFNGKLYFFLSPQSFQFVNQMLSPLFPRCSIETD